VRIDIKGRKVAVTDDLRQRIEKRFEKIARQVPLAELEIELSEEKSPRIAESQIADATLRLKGTTLRARESASNMVTAINECADDLARQVKRNREKKRLGRRAAAQPPMADSGGGFADVAAL
jgi:putative sigma-54 modulation protein